MGQFFIDMLSFLKSLSPIDFILYFAVLVLIILVISLIYILKTSDNEFEYAENSLQDQGELQPIKLSSSNETLNDVIDLKEIVNTIDEKPTPVIDMTAYEAEQEEKAIISYDELINSTTSHPINYDTEELIDNMVKVKKINLENITNPNIVEETPRIEVKLFTYDHEEAFLKTLQQLNELLN